MLTTQALRQKLEELGFTALTEEQRFGVGPVQVCILDTPRLLFSGPGVGWRYVAVLSLEHLAQEVEALVEMAVLAL